MRLSNRIIDGEIRLCAEVAGRPALLPGPLSMMEAVRDIAALRRGVGSALESPVYAPEHAPYAPVVESPQKIICVGLNYATHARECKRDKPRQPVLFAKFSNTLRACGDAIALPRNTKKVDYEAELVVVIGRGGKDIPLMDAPAHIFGYTCGNDLSARDLQAATGQWLSGKTLDGFAPIGPVLVTADELDPSALSISSRVNGQLRQSDNTSSMIFSCGELVSHISGIMTLAPGDIIFTGTPSGVALGYPKGEEPWLAPGDVVEIEIEGIGVLKNTMVAGDI